jgi:hypothetical protein
LSRTPLFIIAAQLAIVVAMGVALATIHGRRAGGSQPAAATARVADGEP